MDRLQFLAHRLDVEIKTEIMVEHAVLTHRSTCASQLAVSSAAERWERLPAAATLLHVAALGWPGRHFPVFAPGRGTSWEVREAAMLQRRDYRRPFRLGLRTLMPDDMVARWAREQVLLRDAAEEAGVSEADAEWRIRTWKIERASTSRRDLAGLEDLFDQGLLRRAVDLLPNPKVVQFRRPSRQHAEEPPADVPPAETEAQRGAKRWAEVRRAYELQQRGVPTPGFPPLPHPLVLIQRAWEAQEAARPAGEDVKF